MKQILFLIVLITSTITKEQIKLEPKDLNNLITIGEIYSLNTNARGEKFAKSLDALRTPKLNPIIDVFISVGKGDKTILEHQFLERPNDEELMLWYVIREIHYNRINKKNTPKPNLVVANDILKSQIDSRWLLDNYYYRIHGGIANLFNEADLSEFNFDIENLGFKDNTEKAIFYFNMMESLAGGRFKVLQMMKNNKKIIEFSDRLPKFNGKDYYNYKNFDFDDFEWIGYDESKRYKEVNLGILYNTLIAQFAATVELKGKKEAQEIYFNSILHEPKYFKYSQAKDDLQLLFDKSK